MLEFVCVEGVLVYLAGSLAREGGVSAEGRSATVGTPAGIWRRRTTRGTGQDGMKMVL